MSQEQPTAILLPSLTPDEYAKQAAELIRCLKPQITPGVRHADQLIAHLQSRYTVREMEKNELPASFLDHCAYNALQSHQALTLHELYFRCFGITCDTFSKRLYAKEQCEDCVFVVFETRTGYCFSNNNQLLLELVTKKGISQKDYDAESYALLLYLRYWKEYQSLLLGGAL